MTQIFDFAHTYSGIASIDEENFPCNLSFPDCKILFKLIGNSSKQFSHKVDFAGIITTENGIMSYKALNTTQISWSSGTNGIGQQAFLADQLLVVQQGGDLNLNLFSQANIIYKNLHKIGRFVEIEEYDTKSLNFKFSRTFEEIILKDTDDIKVTLENPVTHHLRQNELQLFSLNLEPFVACQSTERLDFATIQLMSNNIGWFFQLLFEIQNLPSDIILFEKPLEYYNTNNKYPYFYFAPELIKRKISSLNNGRPPTIEINGLAECLKNSFEIWSDMNVSQVKLSSLYFNEINSEQYVIDDRFKNLCAIIQGLEVLGTSEKIPGIKGEMNAKLRRVSVPNLEIILRSFLNTETLYKLYEIIGDQRDHYQHLNKPLKHDLALNTEEFNAVNKLLTIIIRYHFLCFIQIPQIIIETMIHTQANWQASKFLKTARHIENRYNLKTTNR